MNDVRVLHSGRNVDGERVEELVIYYFETKPLDNLLESLSEAMNFVRNVAQANRAMIHGIHSRHVGKQGLTGANVACSFLPADMLFASFNFGQFPNIKAVV